MMNSTKNARPNVAALGRDRSTQNAVSTDFEAQLDCITPGAGLQGRLALKPTEVGQLLGIGRNRAYDLCRRPGFPAIRVGENSIIVPVDALRRWLDAQAGGVVDG